MKKPKTPLRLDDLLGYHIDRAIANAIALARDVDRPVVFDFNEVEVTVDKGSSHGLIYRDWSRAMSGFVPGKKVGPNPKELSAEDLANDARIQAETERCRAEQEVVRQRQQALDEAEVGLALAETPPLALTDADAWQKGLAANQDGYGRAIFEFAEAWGRLMQAEIDKGKALPAIADACCTLAGKRFGISGFMYGAAVSILAKAWIHGSDLKRWHNAKYGRPDAEGTVNPAILTIGEPKPLPSSPDQGGAGHE